LKSGLRARSSNQPHDGGVIGQGLTGPVLTDLAKESVLDRIPLGGPGGIVTDSDRQLVAINQFFLSGPLGSNLNIQQLPCPFQKLQAESDQFKVEKLTCRKAIIKRAANKQQANFRGMASTHQYRL
jgi:hypothetical protein